jgi:large repetitive protein
MLVAGGVGSSGPLNTVEIYGTGGAFTVSSPMGHARAGAACATLLDGTVLVMGGDDGSGALSTAEIFNPITQTWKATGSLNAAREGHQAVINGWGAVWVAGGTNASGIVAALEEFDPATSTFRTVGTLTTPRTEFAMALLPGLKVMLAGGTNGSATLSSVEIYNGVLGTVSVAGSMAQARQDFAAAALPDGTVLVTGGRDAKGNLLGSTEIFDPVQGVSAAGPSLLTPRAYHAAYGLANNGQVLIAGGTGASGVLASTETYAPWTGVIQQTAPFNINRRDNVSAVLRPGSLLVAGGRNDGGSLNSSELFHYVAIGTDKPDYAPGTPVNIAGSGWQPGESVSVQVMASPVDQHHIEFTGSGIADGAGNVTVSGFAVDQSHLGMKFILTATGSQLQAQTTFTDGSGTPTITFSFSPPSGTLPSSGAPVTVTVTLTGASGTPTGSFAPCINGTCNISGGTTPVGGSCPAVGQVYTLPSSGAATCQFTIPVIPSGNTIVSIAYSGDVNYSADVPPTNGATYSVTSPTSTSMTSGPSGNTPYGTTTPYVATVTAVAGNALSGQLQFLVNGVASGSPMNLTPVIASNPPAYTASFLPNPPLAVNAAPYLITARYLGDPANTTSTSGNSISTMITAANTTTTVIFSANPIVYGQPLTLSGTVTSGGGIPSGTVTVVGFTGTAGCTGVTLTATGTYSCTITPPGPGASGSPYTAVLATYVPAAGTGFVTSTSAPGTLTVNHAGTQVSTPDVTAVTGGTVFTFHAQATTLSPSVAPVNAGNIEFLSAPGSGVTCPAGLLPPFNPIGAGPVVDGTGNASSGPVTLAVGSYTICAVYVQPGVGNFAGPTPSAVGQNITSPTVQTADTVTAPTGGPGTFGLPVTITATVMATTGAAPPTPGTLTFIDTSNGNAQIGTAQPVTQVLTSATATASVTVSNLTVGPHLITATYGSGNGAFVAPTVSAPGTITINKSPATFTISSGAPNLVLSGANTVVGSSATLIATYTGGLMPLPTGTVNFINAADGNAVVCAGATLTNGVATCTVVVGPGTNLPAGPAIIAISYAGDTDYSLGVVTPFGFTVTKVATITLLVPFPNPATVGNTVTLTAGVTVTNPAIVPTGTVTFTLGGNVPPTSTCTAPIALTTNAGPPVTYTAVCHFELAGPGGLPPIGAPIAYSATYNGDTNTLSSTGTNSLTSIRAATTTALVATPNPATVGQTVTLTATLTTTVTGINPTGTYSFTLGGISPASSTCGPAVAIVAGVATCTFELAGPAPSVTYTATYSGDTNFLTSTNTTSLTVNKAATTTTLTATPNPTALGTIVTLMATVSLPTPGTPVAQATPFTGSYTFGLSGTLFSSTVPNSAVTSCSSPVPVSPAGVATCSFEIYSAANTGYTFTATYGNDASFLASTNSTTLNTTKAPTGPVSFVLSPAAPASGQPITLTATVPPSGLPTPLPVPTGTVTITGSGVNITATLVNGVATVITGTGAGNLPVLFAGTFNLVVTYNGDTNYLAGAAVPLSPALVIGKANSVTTIGTSGTNIVVTVAPCDTGVPPACTNFPGAPTPTGAVTIFSAAGTQVASGVLANGALAVLLPSGSYVANYAGDNNYLPSSSGSPTGVVGRSPATTTTSLTSNINPVPANQPVVLTASVTGSGATSTPTGSVTFTSNGILLGVAVLTGGGGSTGVASITTTLAGGSNTIVATYSGDSVYSGSSGVLQLTVNKPPSTILLSSNLSVSVFGQSVTLTVRVTGSTQGGTTQPTGTVTFFDNNVNIGVGNVVNGVATLTLSNLPVGVNNFTVVYSGDANFGSAQQGNAGSVTVNKAQILTTLAANTNNGQETLTATVAVVAPGAGTPTGTVQFVDTVTGKVVGTATLAGGTASITIPVTTDPIMAVYSGDGNFSTSATTNVSAIAVVNAASYSLNFAQDEIATVFGSGLTTQTLTATLPLPNTLGGVSVMVTDSAGTARPAALFYVSAGQLAFLIPDGTAPGTATVTVTTASAAFTATITVTKSAPGIFTANDNGAGPLAAQVVSVAPGGTQTYTNTAALTGQSFANAPISLTPAGDTFYLLLYGTGIRFGSVITVSINGTTYTPTFAGAQGTYAGLDQINVLLPASLAGSGAVTVTVTVDGTVSNAGTIAFQ